ncbi:MAG TPA: hypothetical protein VI316_04540 [Candidatus Dormibacteraeota bacterium]
MRDTRCPLCRSPVPPAATNCPRCGARIATLPRRRRADRVVTPAAAPAPRGEARRAGLLAVAQGITAGLGLTAACALLAAAVHLGGGSAYATFGDATLAAGGVCVCAAVLAGGVRLTRWGEYGEMRSRLERTRHLGNRRAILMSAGLLLLLVSALTAARH